MLSKSSTRNRIRMLWATQGLSHRSVLLRLVRGPLNHAHPLRKREFVALIISKLRYHHRGFILMLTGVAFWCSHWYMPSIFLAQAPYRCTRLFIVFGLRVPEVLYDAFASSQVHAVHFCFTFMLVSEVELFRLVAQ